MTLGNSETRFGAVTKTLHWLTALGIAAAIPLGIIANGAPYDTAEALAQKATLFSLHKTLGVGLFFVALARIVWAFSQPRPAPLHPDRRAEVLLASVVHWLLYGSLLVVPLSGWVHHAATTGFAPILWPLGQGLPFVPQSVTLAETAAALHIIFERVLVLSILLHVAGAVKHHFIDRDATLRRMLPGVAEGGRAGARPGLLPPVLALGVWGAALGIGAGLGLFAHDAAGKGPALAQVASDWQVQDGSLTISVQQMGATVGGSFADWTAAIRYDDTGADGPQGAVEVTIAIASLTLGSVTAQAMGPDYFDATQFPTAQVAGDILRRDGGLWLDGTLTLRGAAVPLSMPVKIVVEGDTARASGQITLDRRAFGIGTAMTDPGQLGFDVVISVDLTALRTSD